MKILSLFIFLLGFNFCYGQDNAGVNAAVDIYPNPKKASLYSAIFPGAGQIYNKKYWKLPIIYGGMGVATYYLIDNLKNIDFFRTNLIYALDDDPSTEPDPRYATQALSNGLNQYKSWRDWSYVTLVAIYALNIIDAGVDANLAHFDVGEDLSLNVHPFMDFTVQRAAGLSLVLKL